MLQLTRIQQQDSLRKYCFEEYSRPDYLARAVVILVDAQFTIRSIRFNSAAHGLVAYSFGRGMTESSAWEDETASRSISTNSIYYSMTALGDNPAIAAKVIDDVLKSAPQGVFCDMVGNFTEDTHREIPYLYAQFRLQPIKTTGQIRVFHYRPKEEIAPRAPLAFGEIFSAILRHLNPLCILRATIHSVLNAIDNIRYRCPHCGTDNRLLARHCVTCKSRRPALTARATLVFSLRALIDMTYFLYALVSLSFLFYALFHRA